MAEGERYGGASLASVRAAHERIKPYINRTPVHTCSTLNKLASEGADEERELFFKCELFQKVGAFKFRGAMNAVLCLPDGVRSVVTHSSGNHAQALALAARLRGLLPHIVMPENASAVKRQAVEGYGGIITTCAPTQAAREETCARIVKETGGALIPPYDHVDVISGQGTLALELLEEVPDLDALLVPVGGGGMLSGVALAARGARPVIRVLAAEPLEADDVARSFAEGRLVPQTAPATVADGLRTGMSPLTWSIIRENVEGVITVTEEEIVRAMRLVFERMKLVIEPSAAVGVAAALTETFRTKVKGCRRVGVVLCGGNVDLDALPWIKR
eukprot:tig00000480_g1308.t1